MGLAQLVVGAVFPRAYQMTDPDPFCADDLSPLPALSDVNGALNAEMEIAGAEEGGQQEDEDLIREGMLLSKFQRIYPAPTGGRRHNYPAFIAHAVELEHKLLKGSERMVSLGEGEAKYPLPL